MPILTHQAAGGLDLRAPAEIKPNTFAVADNADMRFAGEVHKLDGYEELSTDIAGGGTLAPYQIEFRGDELIAWDSDDRLYSWDATVSAWRLRGEWTQCDLTTQTVAPRIGHQFASSGAAIGTMRLFAWEAENSSAQAVVDYEVRDDDGMTIATGTIATLGGDALVGDATPIVRANATHWAILYSNNASGSGALEVRFVAASSPETVSSASTLHTYTTPTQPLCRHDMISDGTTFYAASFDTISATPTAVVASFVSSSVTTNTFATTAGSMQRASIAYFTGADNFTLLGLLADDQTLEMMRVSATTLALVDDDTHTVGSDTYDSVVSTVFDEDAIYALIGTDAASRTDSLDQTRKIEVLVIDVSAAPSVSSTDTIENATVSHKPFKMRGRMFAPIMAQAELVTGTSTVGTSQTSESYIVYDLDRSEVCARFYAGGQARLHATWRQPVDVDGTTAVVVAGFNSKTSDTFRDVAIGLVTIDFAQEPRPAALVQGMMSLASGGFVRAYDGRDIFELDWHTLPVATIALAGSGGAMSAGTYLWAVYWRWEDQLGQTHQSAPALITRTAAMSDAATITVYGAPHTGRSRVQLGLARTKVDVTDSFFELLSFVSQWDATLGGTIVVVDGAADSAIENNNTYEQAGINPIKPHQATPAGRFVVELNDRLWWGDPEVANLVHFSLACRNGFAPGITPTDILGSCDGQPINAVGEMDGAYFAFSERAIQTWQGDGPGHFDGQTGGFTIPASLPATLGTTSQHLVARVPAGLLYVSPVGPRLLGREVASADPFGAVAPLFLSGRMTASRMLYLASREEAVIYSPEAEVLPGRLSAHPARTLRFSFSTARWSTEAGAQALAAAVAADGDVVFLRRDAQPCRYTPGVYLRGATRSQLALVTSPIGLNNQQLVLQEIRVNGLLESEHTLQVCYAYDDDDYFNDLQTIDTSTGRTVKADASTPPAWMLAGIGFDASPRLTPIGPPDYVTRYTYGFPHTGACYTVRVAISDLTDEIIGTGSAFVYTSCAIQAAVSGSGLLAQLPPDLIA